MGSIFRYVADQALFTCGGDECQEQDDHGTTDVPHATSA